MSKEIDIKELQNYIAFLEDTFNKQQQKIEQLEKEVNKAKSNWVIYQDMFLEEHKKNTKLKERVKELEVNNTLTVLQSYYSKIELNKLDIYDILDLIEKDMNYLNQINK